MNLAELKEAYKARKLALDSAKKEEEKYKALLKDAMLEAGESDYTDEAGYRFERIVQERKSMDEEKKMSNPYETPEQEKRRRETEIPLSNLNSYQRVQFKQVGGSYTERGEFDL